MLGEGARTLRGGIQIGTWVGPFPSGPEKKVTPEHSLITLEMNCACSFVHVNLHAQKHAQKTKIHAQFTFTVP